MRRDRVTLIITRPEMRYKQRATDHSNRRRLKCEKFSCL
jgi:hypothetical protein